MDIAGKGWMDIAYITKCKHCTLIGNSHQTLGGKSAFTVAYVVVFRGCIAMMNLFFFYFFFFLIVVC
jgi:hypothetical protein